MDEFVLTLGEIADKVGRSKPSVANRLRLLDLPDDVLGMVERGELGGARQGRPGGPGQDERRARASSSAAGCRYGPPSRRRAGPARGSARERSTP